MSSDDKIDYEDKPDIAKGFDRGIDFKDMKKKLIVNYNFIVKFIDELNEDDKFYIRTRKKYLHRLIYNLIAMIQLRNGSRIVEACTALPLFLKNGIDNKVIVKIAKSKSVKYKNGEQYETKARYRKIIFPFKWITLKFKKDIEFYIKLIDESRLMKRVLDYMLKYFNCNTHSLRYAFINFMLHDQKKEMSIVAKAVGHVNVDQMVRYTQTKNVDKLMDEDI